VPREEEDVLFDYALRNRTIRPPSWQREIAEDITDIITEIMMTSVEISVRNNYILQLKKAFSVACVQTPVAQRIPEAARIEKERVKTIAKNFSIEHDAIVRKSLDKHAYFAACIGLLGAVAGVFLLQRGEPAELVPAFANYLLVFAASMAALVVGDFLGARVTSAAHYQENRHQYERPFVRIFVTGILSVAVALSVSTRVLNINLGTVNSSELSSNTTFALLVGFFCGLPGSVFVKRLLAIARGVTSSGRESSARRRRG
jgi:hypothetical protein